MQKWLLAEAFQSLLLAPCWLTAALRPLLCRPSWEGCGVGVQPLLGSGFPPAPQPQQSPARPGHCRDAMVVTQQLEKMLQNLVSCGAT